MHRPTVRAVTDALLVAGERPATRPAGGFRVDTPRAGLVIVRWCAPEHERGSDAGLGFVEDYARLLRAAGIRALVATEIDGPRVVCSPGPALGQRRVRRETERREAERRAG